MWFETYSEPITLTRLYRKYKSRKQLPLISRSFDAISAFGYGQFVWTLALSINKHWSTNLLCVKALPGTMATHVSVSRVLMTSSNGNILRVTGPLWGESTGHRWIPLAKTSGAELWCFLWSMPEINGWADNRDPSDLRRHCTYYDITVMGWVNDEWWPSGVTDFFSECW